MIQIMLVMLSLIGLSTGIGSVYADHYMTEVENEFNNYFKDIEQENEDGDNIINVENNAKSEYEVENEEYKNYNYRDSYVDDEYNSYGDYEVKVRIVTAEDYDHVPDLKVKVKDQTKQIQGNEEFGNGKSVKTFSFDDNEIHEGQKFKACLKALNTGFKDMNVCHQLKRTGAEDSTTFELY